MTKLLLRAKGTVDYESYDDGYTGVDWGTVHWSDIEESSLEGNYVPNLADLLLQIQGKRVEVVITELEES